MREILFRGKRTLNGDWIEGLLWKKKYKDNRIFISYFPYQDDYEEAYSVNPETVGQYTGLTDKNGTKIFEGDIVVVNIKGYNTICKVAWADNVAQFQLWQINTIPNTSTALNLGNYDCEVIGNIHDNPELLKECEGK